VLLLAYLVFASVYMAPRLQTDKVCSRIEVDMVEGGQAVLGKNQIEKMIRTNRVNPVGRQLSQIRTSEIEKVLQKGDFIRKAEVYKTIGGTVKIRIYQRVPVLRVMSSSGSDYCIDNEGKVMPVPRGFATCVPIATGNISESYAQQKLYDLISYLQKNNYWNNRIEQIDVGTDLEVQLVPSSGNHIVILGKIENYRTQLDKLKFFYEKGLNKVGWNKYSVINLNYKNQVVCTLKNEK
jgi:cell division protein FtsQ